MRIVAKANLSEFGISAALQGFTFVCHKNSSRESAFKKPYKPSKKPKTISEKPSFLQPCDTGTANLWFAACVMPNFTVIGSLLRMKQVNRSSAVWNFGVYSLGTHT